MADHFLTRKTKTKAKLKKTRQGNIRNIGKMPGCDHPKGAGSQSWPPSAGPHSSPALIRSLLRGRGVMVQAQRGISGHSTTILENQGSRASADFLCACTHTCTRLHANTRAHAYTHTCLHANTRAHAQLQEKQNPILRTSCQDLYQHAGQWCVFKSEPWQSWVGTLV